MMKEEGDQSMAFCNECGAEIPVNNKFCNECGTPIPNTGADDPAVVVPATQAEAYGNAQPAPVSANASTPPAPSPPTAVKNIQPPPVNAGFAGSKTSPPAAPGPVSAFPQPVNTTQGVISVGGYVGTLILFSIPIVGWIACIIMAIVAKNQNRRNLARAMLIIIIIMIAISVVFYFILGWIWEVILEYAQGYVEGATGGLFSGFGFGSLFDAAD